MNLVIVVACFHLRESYPYSNYNLLRSAFFPARISTLGNIFLLKPDHLLSDLHSHLVVLSSTCAIAFGIMRMWKQRHVSS